VGEQVETSPNATSQLYYCDQRTRVSASIGRLVHWEEGDFPDDARRTRATFDAETVRDAVLGARRAALLAIWGARLPTAFSRNEIPAGRSWSLTWIQIALAAGANDKSRVSVWWANAAQEQTLTITHVLWAMFGLVPPNQERVRIVISRLALI